MSQQSGNYLDRDQRAGLIRATFDAHVALLFATSKAERAAELLLSPEETNELRGQFRQHMDKHWPDWQAETVGYSDDKLYGLLEENIDRLDALGMMQCRADEVGRSPTKPSSLEKLRQEIETDTRAAQSESERLARTRADKLLGPRERESKPKLENGIEMER